MDSDEGRSGHLDDILRLIYQGTATVTGGDFLRALVRATASAMKVRWAFVSEFAGSHDCVRTLAFWSGSRFEPNFEYDLDGTVCEEVLRGRIGYYPRDVANRFPREPALAELGVESYLATPMTNQNGEVLGHLAVFDTKPMSFSARDLDVFKVFGARAAAELDRAHAQAALRASEARLGSILDSALDVIVTIGKDHRVRLFNKAAERVFRCDAQWAVGQPFDRFLSRQFHQVIGRCVDQSRARGGQVWVPEGITALRADGEQFPIEATISPVTVEGESLFTLILRDVDERLHAKQEIRRLQAENQLLKEQFARRDEFSQIVGDSPAMEAVFEQVDAVAATDTTVLLIGDTGAGKELIAQAIHAASARKDGLLVSVNCAALPGTLIESELFGHEKGAFTGATGQRKGRFELADKGSIFLDEVGELSAQAQAKLLRVLQERTFERVGGNRTVKVDVRVIAATNRDLGSMVRDGSFRPDLFYRLNVFPIRVPGLSERREDIPQLAQHFLDHISRKMGKPLEGIDPRSLERMKNYPWPGNVRELRNLVERAAILARGPIISIDDGLPAPAMETLEASAEGGTLDSVQRSHILEVLGRCEWRIEGPRGAATVLGLKPSTLRYRMRKLGIQKAPRA
ncbi:MAG: sigma 54-interacting transcriptional regulator [Chromatiales bacterium]|jgi:PAS domain S-box-containing protein